MFGYVRPAPRHLTEAEQQRFGAVYCGLCHTLQRRYGFVSRMILNYDFTFLAILLSQGECRACEKTCPRHPFCARPCVEQAEALEIAADDSVILAWWQLQDGIADHSFFGGLKYRLAAWLLGRAYRKARTARPAFDESTRRHLAELTALEREQCPSIDRSADTFARLLSGVAEDIEEESRRRVLQQLLYHLGRWIYLVDAADDLQKDLKSGSYNPLVFRFSLEGDRLSEESRGELAATLDRSVEQMAAAFELADFGDYTPLIQSVVYEGLYAVGNAVLNGTFHERDKQEAKQLK